MKNRAERDRQLLENLDRLLAGHEDEIAKPLDEDTRSATEFSSKMVSLHEKPSSDFTANLRAELIHRLAEQERKERSRNPWLIFGEIPRKKLWQGTIGALIALIILAIIFLIVFLLNRGP